MVLYKYLKMFPFFFKLVFYNPFYFFTPEAIYLKCWHCMYNSILYAMIIICYLSIAVGYMF